MKKPGGARKLSRRPRLYFSPSLSLLPPSGSQQAQAAALSNQLIIGLELSQDREQLYISTAGPSGHWPGLPAQDPTCQIDVDIPPPATRQPVPAGQSALQRSPRSSHLARLSFSRGKLNDKTHIFCLVSSITGPPLANPRVWIWGPGRRYWRPLSGWDSRLAQSLMFPVVTWPREGRHVVFPVLTLPGPPTHQ